MVGLLDIGESRATVECRGKEIEVRGITADGLVHLLKTFPELQKAFGGVMLDSSELNSLVSRFGYTVGEIIAMGCGKQGDSEYIGFAMAGLSLGEQTDFVEKIFTLTFPKGPKSFLDALRRAADSAGVLGKVPHTKSPARSSDLSKTGTDSKTVGE